MAGWHTLQQVVGTTPDGVWGPKSEEAMTKMHDDLAAALRAGGYNTHSTTVTGNPALPSGWRALWMKESDIQSLCADVAKQTRVSAKTLMYIVNHEATNTMQDGIKYYDVKSVSPTKKHLGLMQMGKAAWTTAMGLSKQLPPYERGVMHPYYNILAGALLAQANMRAARSSFGYKGAFSDEIVYSMHNQGAGFVQRAMRGDSDLIAPEMQSKKALAVVSTAYEQIRRS